MVQIELLWPASILWPNASRKVHWSKRGAVAREARAYARYVVLELPAIDRKIHKQKSYHLIVRVYPATARKFDLDGCLSALKPSLDGVCDALGIDDYTFNPITIFRELPEKPAKIIVEIAE